MRARRLGTSASKAVWAPFGKWFSLDGVHPTTAAHTLITNYLINAINAKYSTSLTTLPTP